MNEYKPEVKGLLDLPQKICHRSFIFREYFFVVSYHIANAFSLAVENISSENK